MVTNSLYDFYANNAMLDKDNNDEWQTIYDKTSEILTKMKDIDDKDPAVKEAFYLMTGWALVLCY